jgi:hypothetical protein
MVAVAAPAAQAQAPPPPVIDMHLHANAAASQGPPPLAVCLGGPWPVWDQRTPWGETFLDWTKKPRCPDPIWSPETDDALRAETAALVKRRNILGVLSGSPARVARWRQDTPERFLPGLTFQIGPQALSPDDVRALHAKGQLAVLAEVSNQYVGIAADDPAFEPYLALAEALDIPVGIHVGTGPPGAAYGYLRRIVEAGFGARNCPRRPSWKSRAPSGRSPAPKSCWRS